MNIRMEDSSNKLDRGGRQRIISATIDGQLEDPTLIGSLCGSPKKRSPSKDVLIVRNQKDIWVRLGPLQILQLFPQPLCGGHTHGHDVFGRIDGKGQRGGGASETVKDVSVKSYQPCWKRLAMILVDHRLKRVHARRIELLRISSVKVAPPKRLGSRKRTNKSRTGID
jgi:hypothetical protein